MKHTSDLREIRLSSRSLYAMMLSMKRATKAMKIFNKEADRTFAMMCLALSPTQNQLCLSLVTKGLCKTEAYEIAAASTQPE